MSLRAGYRLRATGYSRILIASVLLTATVAGAGDRVVAIAPLSTLGAEDTSAATKQVIAQIETATAALPDTKVISAAAVVDAIKKAKRPQLKVCEGDQACLAELGKLVGASVVIAGEVGGLGDSRVDAALGARPMRRARASCARRRSRSAPRPMSRAARTEAVKIRLLDPDRYRGTLHFAIDVASGTTVYVNGSKVALSPKAELTLPVGPQAIRVTHPEYHDFVKFIDVQYARTTEVPVRMQQYPIVQHDVQGKPISTDTIHYIDPPRWRRWYVVAPAAVVLGIVTGIIVGAAVHQFPDGVCRKIGGDSC